MEPYFQGRYSTARVSANQTTYLAMEDMAASTQPVIYATR
ncbi:hypothetical protein MAR_008561 [Mya arenaria]|uniref:Uncharacterized protein n=1 Tax=Mya arenaria TaxID=6604 RepID=A0ABY7DZG3_MYAAR|nr:hypothetical protein MAR_008561 [Mya arenaria]